MNDEFRVGMGWDRHALITGRRLILAGVVIPGELGIRAHSDGDVALHAVIDALLGAAGLGDIGQHFPSSDSRWKGASSGEMLGRVREQLKDEGWEAVNLDLTVIVESIRLDPHREPMIRSLEELFDHSTQVNMKFKSGDGMGPVGRGEAVESQSVALIRRRA